MHTPLPAKHVTAHHSFEQQSPRSGRSHHWNRSAPSDPGSFRDWNREWSERECDVPPRYVWWCVGVLLAVVGSAVHVGGRGASDIHVGLVSLDESVVRPHLLYSRELQQAEGNRTSFRVVDSGDPSWFVNHLASGHNFSLAVVLHQNTMLCFSWGLNAHGELGLGSTTSVPDPRLITSLPMQVHGEQLGVLAVSCGKHHVALVTTQAKLFTWGNNKYGQLGHGDYTNRLVPQEVHFAFALATLASHQRALRIKHTILERGGSGTNVTHTACGAFHTLFVTHQQNILAMGYNQAGQLGIGHRLQHLNGWRSCVPIAVETLRDRSVLDVAAGQNHSACVLSNGEVYVWGCSDDGRLGVGTRDCEMQPVAVSSLKAAGVKARSVRCGARHTAIVSDRDLLYVWGANEFGQLGCGDKVPRLKPCLVSFPAFVADGVVDVALGEFHSACVTHRGDAFVWGLDLSGESAQIDQHSTPRRVLLNEDGGDNGKRNGNGECARKVSCGWAHTNIVTHARPDSVVENGGGISSESSGHSSHFHRNLENKQFVLRREGAARWRAHAAPWGLPTYLQYDNQRRGGMWKRGRYRTPAPTTKALVTLPGASNAKSPLKPPVEDGGRKAMRREEYAGDAKETTTERAAITASTPVVIDDRIAATRSRGQCHALRSHAQFAAAAIKFIFSWGRSYECALHGHGTGATAILLIVSPSNTVVLAAISECLERTSSSIEQTVSQQHLSLSASI
ncbi:Rcc1 and btb domain-containing protein 2, partial [Globisporangium splendens]